MPKNTKQIDLSRIIGRLIEEKKRLDLVIASLEGLTSDAQILSPSGEHPVRPRRGRKSMSPEERQLVSERMRTYWQSRKASRENEGSDPTRQTKAADSGAK